MLKGLSQFRSATTNTNAILELEAMRALSVAVHGSTPAHEAAAAGRTSCLRFLSEIGGTAALLHDVQADPELLEDTYSCLLLEPRLLDLPTKQAWLSWSLQQTVDGAEPSSSSWSVGATICF